MADGSNVSVKNKNYSKYSFWLETCGDDLTPRPGLTGSTTVDVAILGAGFTGLWTAYYLLQENPSLQVAIVDKHIAGFGASGRNGGWCTPHFTISPDEMIRRFGRDAAIMMETVMHDTVEEIKRVLEKEKMDVDWAQNGALTMALWDFAVPSLEKMMETARKLGLEHYYELLNKAETEKRLRMGNAKGSLLLKGAAVIHPGKMVRQLARRVEALGAKIYEQTEVIDFKAKGPNTPAQLITSTGTISARQAIVLSGEGYLSQLKRMHRKILPVYSLISLTEPLSDQQWAEIGWENRELVSSTRLSIDYLQRTADKRILIGGRGQPYRFGSSIKDEYDRHKPTHDMLNNLARKWFPVVTGVKFTHSWGGPLGITRDFTPNFQFNKQTGIAGAYGYIGLGVSTTNLSGRILCDLINEKRSVVTELPLIQHSSPLWEPEPLRWIGVRYMQSALAKVDQKAEQTGMAPSGKTLAERLYKH